MYLVDLNEQPWEIEKLYDDGRERFNPKVLYYQEKERVPFKYRQYKKKLLERAKKVVKTKYDEEEASIDPYYGELIDKCDTFTELVRRVHELSPASEGKIQLQDKIYSLKETDENGHFFPDEK